MKLKANQSIIGGIVLSLLLRVVVGYLLLLSGLVEQVAYWHLQMV